MIEVEVLGRKKYRIEVQEDMTVEDIAKKIGLRKVEYVPVVNSEVVTWSHRIKPSDKIRFVPVVSGG